MERKWTTAKKSPPEAADPRLRSGRTEAPGPSVVATFWNSVWVACCMSAIKPPGAINEEKIYKSLNFIGCKALKELLFTKSIKIAESQCTYPYSKALVLLFSFFNWSNLLSCCSLILTLPGAEGSQPASTAGRGRLPCRCRWGGCVGTPEVQIAAERLVLAKECKWGKEEENKWE